MNTAQMIDDELPVPNRTIFFSMDDYLAFEERLKVAGRARFLFIQGRNVVDVDHRAAANREKKLCIGRYTAKNLPHYEGLVSRIHKVAIDYEKTVSEI